MKLHLPAGKHITHWFDIRNGGDLIPAELLPGPGGVALGNPPRDAEKDWVVLLRRKQ